MKLGLLALLGAMAFAQSEPASLSGTVLSASGAPLSKSTVRLVASPGSGVPGSGVPGSDSPGAQSSGQNLITGSNGEFAFIGLKPGTYTITADHVGYLRGVYGGHGGPTVILNVTSGQSLTNLTVRLTPQAAVTGTVADADGDPVPRVQVRLLRQGFVSGLRQLTQAGVSDTDDMGQFRIAGVAAGQYYLGAEPPPGQRGHGAPNEPDPEPDEEMPVFTWFPHSASRENAVPVELRPGETLTGMEIRMARSRAFHVHGTVAGDGGAGAAAAGVGGSSDRVLVGIRAAGGVQRTGGGLPVSQVAAEADGTFDIADVPPGKWILSLTASGGPPTVMSRWPIEVVNQDLEGIILNAQAVPPIHGTIRTETPLPAAPAFRITLAADDQADFPNIPADATGAFTLNGLSAGRYRISVTGIPAGSYLKSITLDDRDVLNSGLEVGGGTAETSRLNIVVGQKAAEINGGVLGADGKAAPGAIVTLIPDPPQPELPQLYLRTNADQNGIFRLSGIAPGTYRVTAWQELEAGEQFDGELLKTHLADSLAVTLAEDERQVMTLVSVPAQ